MANMPQNKKNAACCVHVIRRILRALQPLDKGTEKADKKEEMKADIVSYIKPTLKTMVKVIRSKYSIP
ncbi:hypothetical protein TNCV_4549511 [Trichonephila clavipes]|nr:hypothetical protein TNCV_4549511 [Trichonephila clavipes]